MTRAERKQVRKAVDNMRKGLHPSHHVLTPKGKKLDLERRERGEPLRFRQTP